MNETRKAIIEFISDYMDKTLNEGCIMKGNKMSAIGNYNIEYIKYLSEYGKVTRDDGDINIYGTYYKILGHYDITAVLKYIKDKGNQIGEITETSISDTFYFYIAIGYSNTENGEELQDEMEFEIPNKPLHLYSEQEEIQLLDLLLKLK